MKAPDKIYVYAAHPAPFWFSDKQIPNMIEYISKDALLELIKDEAKFWDDGEMIFGQLLDKLNSM